MKVKTGKKVNLQAKHHVKQRKKHKKKEIEVAESVVKSKSGLQNTDTNYRKKKLEDMTVEEMMAADSDNIDSSEEYDMDHEDTPDVLPTSYKEDVNVPQFKKKEKVKKKKKKFDETSCDSEVVEHKKALEDLKSSDPEFVKFLEENDEELLHFDVSDSEDESKANQKEVASKVSSDEDDADKDSNLISKKMVEKWSTSLSTERNRTTILKVMMAFRAAVDQIKDGNEDDNEEKSKYRIEGGAMFNSVVQLCVMKVAPAVKKYLKLSPYDKGPEKSKLWPKIQFLIKGYMSDNIRFLQYISAPSVIAILLKHIYQMTVYFVNFPKLLSKLVRHLITLWSSSEESVRVLAFLCIIRCTRLRGDIIFDGVLKKMYLSYVRNTKFTSPTTWPLINFMRRSLVEMYGLNQNLAYQHGFVYIRQLAIHLRNAITTQKKEGAQAVYNWQYIHCLNLWASILATLHPSSVLQPLIYPLTQVIIGTINLLPSSGCFPLRFHCVRILTELSAGTKVFIPVLPFLLEIFTLCNFSKTQRKTASEPLNFDCILRVSKSQLQDRGFKDACIDNFYRHVIEYLNIEAHSIGFPELCLQLGIQIRTFIKTSKDVQHCKKLKELLHEVNKNIEDIEKRRKTITFPLSDTKNMEAWHLQSKNQGTPFHVFYKRWKNSGNDGTESFAKKSEFAVKEKLSSGKEKNKPTDVLYSDDSDFAEDDRFMLNENKRKHKSDNTASNLTKRQKQRTGQNESFSDNNDEMVEEMRLSDLSADEDSDIDASD